MEQPCTEDCFEVKPLLREVVLCQNEDLSPVVRKVNNAMQFVSLIFIFWIEIYPVDSAIERLNNGASLPSMSLFWTILIFPRQISLCFSFSE